MIIGVAASAGALIPMIVLSPEQLWGRAGLLITAALILVLIGVAICSWAGKLRDAGRDSAGHASRRSFAVGLMVCIASGLLSACGNLGFAFGSEVIQKALAYGASDAVAGNSLWALITVPLFVCNAGYCGWLLKRRGTGKLFFEPGTWQHWFLGSLMGALWIAGFACYAPGTRRLGSLGTSVGWAIMMAMMIITANVWGYLTGEWKQASSRARRLLLSGVGVLIVAVGMAGFANYR